MLGISMLVLFWMEIDRLALGPHQGSQSRANLGMLHSLNPTNAIQGAGGHFKVNYILVGSGQLRKPTFQLKPGNQN